MCTESYSNAWPESYSTESYSNAWPESYSTAVNRNLGLLSENQQDKLRNSCVAICGLGGLGGPISEILCRLGIGSYKLLDNGTFEASNLNRQVFCFTDTNGRLKTDVTDEYLRKINPEITTEKYIEVSEENIDAILEGVDVVVLSIDSMIPCIIISRAARRLGIPLVEGWAGVFANARVFTNETPTLEEVYNFPTIGREISSISPEEAAELGMLSLQTVAQQIPAIGEYYKPSDWQRLAEKNEGTNLCPFVWMTCSLMASETMKIILGWERLALAPEFAVYDPFNLIVPTQNILL